jgi:hypothetical protein
MNTGSGDTDGSVVGTDSVTATSPPPFQPLSAGSCKCMFKDAFRLGLLSFTLLLYPWQE